MGVILPLVLLGLIASLSPATIVVFVLVLGTARARVNALGFLFGWGLSLTLVFLGAYAMAATSASQSDAGHTSVAVLQVLLGSAMLVVAARVWRRRETNPRSTLTTRWGGDRFLSRMHGLTPVGAVVVGILKQPWAITIAAALVVVQHHTTGLLVAIAFALFTVASTATVGLMFLYYARHPGEAQAQLAALRDRVVAAGPTMGAIAGMLVGGFLLVDGLIGLM